MRKVSAYRIISAEKANGIPVSLACELLDVSRSGYYDWSTRAPCDRALTDPFSAHGSGRVGARRGGGWRGARHGASAWSRRSISVLISSGSSSSAGIWAQTGSSTSSMRTAERRRPGRRGGGSCQRPSSGSSGARSRSCCAWSCRSRSGRTRGRRGSLVAVMACGCCAARAGCCAQAAPERARAALR
jgi:hypothetical protein